MQNRTQSGIGWVRWLAYSLLALWVCMEPGPLAWAAPTATTYRIVQLSSAPFAGGDINAKGQVAFTEVVGDSFRARFYDGRTIRDIGDLGGGTATAVALNDHGQVTGYSPLTATLNSPLHAFFWSAGTGMIDIFAGQPDLDGVAADINNKGQVVGTAGANAFRWSRQTGLQTLASLGFNSSAYALNDAGTVVGFSLQLDDFGDPMDIPVRWTSPSDILALHDLGSRVSGARDINNAGHIVGGAPFQPNPFGFDQAFLWTPQGGLLQLFPDADGSSAFRINDKGTIIGSVGFGGVGGAYIRFRDGSLIQLGGPGIASSALDLNNRDQVVGSLNERAYIWTRQEGVVDLNTRVPGAPSDLVLVSAVGIAENGSILVSANTGLLLLVPNAAGGQPPVAGPIKLTGSPHAGQALSFHASFKDVDLRDTHTATWSWGDGSQDAGTVSEKNGSGSVSGQHVYRKAGIYTVTLTITDSSGRSVRVQRKVAVCASGAALAGAGQFLSAPGALKAEPQQSGVAQLAFVSAPGSGGKQASIEFSAPGLEFRSTQIGGLMVRGNQFQYQGEGSVNGKAGYGFKLSATHDGGGEDRVHIRIWRSDKGSRKEVPVYDNARGATTDGVSIGRGAITIQSH